MNKSAEQFAKDAHKLVNHFYDGRDYAFHLELVTFLAKFFYKECGFTDEGLRHIMDVGWNHDSLEDCRNIGYNDLVEVASKEVAEDVFLLTENKGRNRKERHDRNYYEGIATSKVATFVKLCDICANSLASLIFHTSMHAKYKKEFPFVLEHLYGQQFDSLVHYIRFIFTSTGKLFYQEISDFLRELQKKYPKTYTVQVSGFSTQQEAELFLKLALQKKGEWLSDNVLTTNIGDAV